jgi:hypothetical protein
MQIGKLVATRLDEKDQYLEAEMLSGIMRSSL